jgi:predicted DNA-binding protein (MmcQ/YjbR family)
MAANTPASRIGKLIREHALAYPQTTEAFPWGEHAFKVSGKTFVFMRDAPGELSFSVKLPQSRSSALLLPGAEPTHYGMGAKGWVTLRPDAKTSLKVLYAFIEESYRAIAPKRVLASLAEKSPAAPRRSRKTTKAKKSRK